MPRGITLKFNDASFRRLLRVSPKVALRAGRDVVNIAAKKVTGLTAKSVGGAASVPQKLIRRRTKTRSASAKSVKTLTATVQVITWPISPAGGLGAQELKRGGVSARGGHKWPNAFIARSPSGRKTVYTRRPGAWRLPIEREGVEIHDAAVRALRRISKREMTRLVNRRLAGRMRYWAKTLAPGGR